MSRDVLSAQACFDTADEAWAKSRDVVETLRLLDASLVDHGSDARLLNYAGWLRTAFQGDDAHAFSLGVEQLRAAITHGAEDFERPLINLAEALGSRGRAQEAIEVLKPWLDAHPFAAQTRVSLGWLQGVVLGDDAAGRASLERVAWLPDAQLNLGRLHARAGRDAEAELALFGALRSFRPHEAWVGLGEYAARRGHLRRALSAMRRAVEVDGRGEYAKVTLHAVQVLGNQLFTQGKYFPHVHEASLWSRELEHPQGPPDRLPRPLSEFAQWARESVKVLGPEAKSACEAILQCAEAGALVAAVADQSPALMLEAVGETERAAEWREVQRALYDELLDLEEPLPGAPTEVHALRSATARRDWGAAFEVLESLKDDEGELLGQLAELLGDRLARAGESVEARRAWQLAESGYARFASGATAGGEGLARMLAVRRMRARAG